MTNTIADLIESIDCIVASASNTIIFAVSTTTHSKDQFDIYIGAVRSYDYGTIISIVVPSQNDILVLLSALSSRSSHFLIDIEKKKPFTFKGPSSNQPEGTLLSNIYPSLEEIRSIFDKKSHPVSILPWKPNDITVQAAFNYVMQITGSQPGNQICLIGLGNIGFKLSLRLIEAGNSVRVFSRNHYKAVHLCNAINDIKPVYTISSAIPFKELSVAAAEASLIVNCSSSSHLIDVNLINTSPYLTSIIDVGKHALTPEAIMLARQRSVATYRLDITDELYYEGLRLFRDPVRLPSYKRLATGEYLIERGYLGVPGDSVYSSLPNGEFLGSIDENWRLSHEL